MTRTVTTGRRAGTPPTMEPRREFAVAQFDKPHSATRRGATEYTGPMQPEGTGATMKDHIPPLGFHALTGLYDRVMAWTMPEQAFRRRVVEVGKPRDGENVLDFGCGTGELTLALKSTAPGARVVALDPDEGALGLARAKLAARGVEAHLVHGASDCAALASGSFDLVVSSLVLHHVDAEAKRRIVADLFRLLRPGGRLCIGDWGGARSAWDRARFLPVRLLDGFAVTEDNIEGRLPDLIRTAGFVEVEEVERMDTVFGPLAVIRGERTE